MADKLQKIYGYIITILMLAVSGYLFITGLFVYNDIPCTRKINFIRTTKWHFIILAFLFVFVLLTVFKNKIEKINSNKLIKVLIVYTLSICVFTVIVLSATPKSDQAEVLQLSLLFKKGIFVDIDNGPFYIQMYPFQLPLIFLNEIIAGIFGERNIIFWMIANTCFIIGIQYLIYKFSKNNLEEKYINFILLIQFLNVPLCLFSSFVYGNIISLFFATLCIYLIFDRSKKITTTRIIISSICLSLACLLKNNNSIILIAITITIFLLMFKDEHKLFLVIPLSLILFFGLLFASKKIYEVRSNEVVGNGQPTLVWIAMGLSETSTGNGWYIFNFGSEASIEEYDFEGLEDYSKKIISDRINVFVNDPSYGIRFFHKKLIETWLTPDFQGLRENLRGKAFFSENAVRSNIINDKHIFIVIQNILDIFMEIVYCGAFIYFISEFINLIKKKEYNLYINIFSLIILGGFIFHIFWETKALYAVTYYALFFPLSAIGWYRLVSLTKKSA